MTPLEILKSEFTYWRLKDLPDYQPYTPQTDERITILDLKAIDKVKLFELGFRSWDDELTLLPLWVLELIAPESQLISIGGELVVVGAGRVDTDTRWGVVAYGFR